MRTNLCWQDRGRWVAPAVLVLAWLGLVGMAAHAAESASGPAFVPVKVSGEVLHVPDGGTPVPLKGGETVSGGNLVVMEDSEAEVRYPGGQVVTVPGNTMVRLVPGQDTLENACKAALTVRDPFVVFVQPATEARVAADAPFAIVVGVKLDATAKHKAGDTLLVVAHPADEEENKGNVELASFRLTPEAKRKGAPPAGLDFRYVKVTSGKGLPVGEYDLFLKTAQPAPGESIGKRSSFKVVRPAGL